MVPSEYWIPPCFSAPKEVLAENLTSLFHQHLHLSAEEQFNGAVKSSSLDRKKNLIDSENLWTNTTVEFDPAIQEQLIADKTVSDCVEALIGAFLQVCWQVSFFNLNEASRYILYQINFFSLF